MGPFPPPSEQRTAPRARRDLSTAKVSRWSSFGRNNGSHNLDYLEDEIEAFSRKIGGTIATFDETVALLDTIPGVNRRTAEVLIAEIGPDMSRFPSAGHLVSWAGLGLGNNESAGKHKSDKTRKGDRWLRIALTESAMEAVRETDLSLSSRIPPDHAAPGSQEGDCGGGSFDPLHQSSHALQTDALL